MLLLGIDAGSSSIKASVIDGESGVCLASAFSPETEMKMMALNPGWAEQDPEIWWEHLVTAVRKCLSATGKRKNDISAIGISYQMHGLVLVDNERRVIRPSIIWCDSRAVDYGKRAMDSLGKEYCLSHLLNSPGNFTASKLAWVKEHEPEKYNRIFKIMLPGDYLAMKLTGEILTSYSGLSEGIFWDYEENQVSTRLMDHFGFDSSLLAEAVPSFSIQGTIRQEIASELGLPSGIPVSYRSGDQPNNALSLNVLEPCEVAATAGTSGVIYGVTDKRKVDHLSRVNTFLHVNSTSEKPILGILLCINGTGILNSWIKRTAGKGIPYDEMNMMAETIAPGCNGLSILPFGNGAERILQNSEPGSVISGLNFNTHTQAHLFRATQEGIAFSFRYGLDILRETGIDPSVVRAGSANMFLSNVFRETLASVTGVEIHLYNTDGSVGAARGAGLGCGIYASEKEAFTGLKPVATTTPDTMRIEEYQKAYYKWLELLEKNK